MKYVLWGMKAFSVFLMLTLYMILNVPCLRTLHPLLAQRLHKFPGLSVLADYEALYRMDAAFLFGIMLALLSCFMAFVLMRMLVMGQGLESETRTATTLILCSAFGLADLIIFYRGLVGRAGGFGDDSVFSFTALLLTIMYGSCLLGIAYFQVYLEMRFLKGANNA